MIDYTLDISKYILFVGFINVFFYLVIYFYNKRESNGKFYVGLSIIYTVIQIGYRYFLYYFNSYGVIGSFSKFSIAHVYYNNLIVLIISLVLCFIFSFITLKIVQKTKGNISYIGFLLLLVGFYTGIL